MAVAVDSANDPASSLGPETEQPTAAERTIENFDHLSGKVSSGRFEVRLRIHLLLKVQLHVPC